MQESMKKMQKSGNSLMKNIISYLEYLKNNCDLKISIHFDDFTLSTLPQPVLSEILPYNSHTNPYCVFVKRKSRCDCLHNQKKILDQCKSGMPFYNVCYAGVYEYIYPVFKHTQAVGFIALSGHRQKETTGSVENISLWEEALDSGDIPTAFSDILIPPLIVMLEQLLENCHNSLENEYNLILQFLNEYHCDISLSDLSKHFNRSPSHISHLFKKERGLTIRAYCNDLKLEDAAELLSKTNKSVTEVAYDTGFNDTSYFIHLFKQKFGVSPLRYKKEGFAFTM